MATAPWCSIGSASGSRADWPGRRRADYELLDEVESLADKLYRATTPVVLVTTEIGLGFLPASVPDRRLISVVGLADRILAERAQSVVMMVSGVPLRLR